jgi:hypothetical protein
MLGIVGGNCREVTKEEREKSEISPKDATGKIADTTSSEN